MANAVRKLPLGEIYEFALRQARLGGSIIREAFPKLKQISEKAHANDLVTETDQLVEKTVVGALRERYPDHRFIGEEDVAATGCVGGPLTDVPTWMIDPIDGTTNFVHTFPSTCISIGLVVDKKPVIGIVYDPINEELYSACESDPCAFLNGFPIQCSSQTSLAKSLCLANMGGAGEATLPLRLANVSRVANKSQAVRSIGSACLSMCLVARGAAEVYFELGPHCWDYAGGWLIVEKAGGCVAGFNGGPFDVMSRGALVTANPALRDAVGGLLEPFECKRDDTD